MMKRGLALLMALALVMAAFGALAEESAPQMSSTLAFMAMLDENEIVYDAYGPSDSGNEEVDITFPMDNVTLTAYIYFDSDNEGAALRIWDLITFAPERFAEVVSACNEMNLEYRWVKFVADPSDNTVYVTADICFRDEDVADVVLETLGYILRNADGAYPTLEPFAE